MDEETKMKMNNIDGKILLVLVVAAVSAVVVLAAAGKISFQTTYNSNATPIYPERGASGITEDSFYVKFEASTDAPSNEVYLDVWADEEHLVQKNLGGGTIPSGKTYNVSIDTYNYYSDSDYEWQVTIWEEEEDGGLVLIYSSPKYSFDTYDVPPVTRTLTTDVDPAGAGTITLDPSGGVYEKGTVVTVNASPSSGYTFDHWTGDIAGTPYVNIRMDRNWSITAHFTGIVREYTLTVDKVGAGYVDIQPEENTYDEGTEVTLTAHPNMGWTFDHWEGDVASSMWLSSVANNPLTVTMNRDRNITAYLVENTTDTYTLTVDADPSEGGIVQPSSYGPYSPGDTVTVTANPNSGYTFDHWSGDASGSSTSVDVYMDSDKSVTAHFEEKPRGIPQWAIILGSIIGIGAVGTVAYAAWRKR